MKITILIDNKPAPEGLCHIELKKEWGLSVFVEYENNKILLDAGQSGAFYSNAKALGIDLSEIDFGVLSHAHFDHSNGMETFFKGNYAAPFYLRKTADENCYHKILCFYKYIGIKKGTLQKYEERIRFAEGDFKILDGVYLIPHKTVGLEKISKASHLAIKRDGHFMADDLQHEQSLVFETEKGLVIMNSCSHGGAYNIIQEIQNTFPDKKIYAILGGFHLFGLSDAAVRDFAMKLKNVGVEKIYTGHCTGEKAYLILKQELGDKVIQIHTGMSIDM